MSDCCLFVRGTEVVSFILKIESHGKKRKGSAGKLRDKKITSLVDAFKCQKWTHLFFSTSAPTNVGSSNVSAKQLDGARVLSYY